ncbi:MAG: hypothetical protein JOZ25_02970 [Actinobacteria bacterium]|nr:hypothetical protein [Actinomycetota bacterium]
MEPIAQELDSEALVGPAAVDSPTPGHLVGDRQRQARPPKADPEATLELAEQHVDVADHDLSELRDPRRALGADSSTAAMWRGVVR